MGEIAEMMLDGTLCACCGDFLGDDAGYPIYCAACAPDFEQASPPRSKVKARKAQRINSERQAAAGKAFGCAHCTRRFRSAFAVEQHARDKHRVAVGASPQ